MSPPGGTTGRGQVPPKDHYSPQACANCHGDSSIPNGSALGLSAYQPLNPENLKFLPSPSDCPAEIFWPDSLKTYQDIVEVNPYMKGQNYLDTLLQSRQGAFPLEVHDSSLEFYLGLKGPATFPKFNLDIPHDAGMCAGPSGSGSSGFEACQGLKIELKNEDIGLVLEGLDLVTAQGLDLEVFKVLGISLKQTSIRDGKLLLTTQLGNPFLNAAFPLVFTSDGLMKKFPPVVQKLLKSAAPNPYDPDLYDIDVTSLILEKIPVAYRVATGEAVNYSEFQATTDKLGLKTLPYFFNMAREGKFPSRLSFNQLFETVGEYTKHVKPSEKKQDEAQKELLQRLLETLSVRARLHPGRLLFKNLYVEFDDVPGKNLFETNLTLKNLKDAELVLTAPLQLRRLYNPGKIDITHLKGDLGLVYRNHGESEVRLDNLEMELGHLEYTGAQDKGPPGLIGLVGKLKKHFKFDPTRPAMVAILGGRISTVPDIVNPKSGLPVLRVKGDPTTGFNVEANLRMEGVRLRLPVMGEVTIHGNIEAKLKLVPEIKVETLEDGSVKETTQWLPEPHSLRLRLSDLEITTEKGHHWSQASIEISDNGVVTPLASSKIPGAVSLKINLPEMKGGGYTSLRLEGGMNVPKGTNGLYDFEELAKGIATDLTMHVVRIGGNPEDWALKLTGNHSPTETHLQATLDGSESDPSGTVQGRPIEGLEFQYDRQQVGDKTSYSLNATAKKMNFPNLLTDLTNFAVVPSPDDAKKGGFPFLQFTDPKFGLLATVETTANGGSLYTIPTLSFSANPWKSMPKAGLVRGPVWLKQMSIKKKDLSIEIDGASPTFEIKNLNLDFGVQGVTHDKIAKATGGRITGVDLDGALRGFWKMDYDKFKGKGMLTLAGDEGGEGDIHLRGADFLRLVKDDPRDPDRWVEIPIFSKTTWTLWNILGVDNVRERINGAFRLSTKVDPAFARVFDVIIDNGKVMNWMMNHDHLPYTGKGYTKKMEEYISIKAAEERKAEDARKAEEARKATEGKTP